MISRDCPGLPAESIVAWLAAVGATVLAGLRLHWTAGGTPYAVLSSDDVDPIDALVESWPTTEALKDMPIAEHWRQTEPMKRHVPAESFRERAKMARSDSLSWTLSATVTDLHIDRKGKVSHGPFDPPVPKGIWLHHRLATLHGAVELSAGQLPGSLLGQATRTAPAPHPPIERAQLRDSLLGQATRVQRNGLGFDQARLGSLADDTEVLTDPVVEILAFFGLALFPVRGEGVDERMERNAARARARQRGWRWVEESPTRCFTWPAWSQPLDNAGIDALLDVWLPDRKADWAQLGIQAGWQSVDYQPWGKERTSAYGSKRL